MRCTKMTRPDETILRIEGTLDALSVPELWPVVRSLVAERPPLVTLDLTALRMIDSLGVRLLIALHKRLAEQGGSLRAVGVCEQPLVIFQLLRLHDYFSPAGRAHTTPARVRLAG